MDADPGVEEFDPVGHDTQTVELLAPDTAEYVPAPQLLHAALPPPILYVPATHAAHGPPSGPVYPALQAADTQSATASLDIADMVPAGHATQVDALVAAAVPEYVPAAQSEHGAVPSEEY